MEQEFIKKLGEKQQEDKLRFATKPIVAPDASDFLNEEPERGSEEARKERVQRHKKKLESENKLRLKKRRLVCFSCGRFDGICWCNITECPADHPIMIDWGKGHTNHMWARCGGTGKCEQIPDIIPVTRDGQ